MALSTPPRPGSAPASPPRPGALRRALSRLAKDDQQLRDEGLQGEVRSCGATAVTSCGSGGKVRVAGSLESVTFRPQEGLPTLEAELYDGTGRVTLVWLGRRRIAGILPGRGVVAHGRLVEVEGRRVIYNPAYELRPASSPA